MSMMYRMVLDDEEGSIRAKLFSNDWLSRPDLPLEVEVTLTDEVVDLYNGATVRIWWNYDGGFAHLDVKQEHPRPRHFHIAGVKVVAIGQILESPVAIAS